MSPEQITALGLALLIGLTLGALGSGGSIIALPVLVYVAGIEARSAVAMSMVIVGGISVVAAWMHGRRGNFHRKAALLFAGSGMGAAYLGSAFTYLVPQQTLMLIFAGILLVVGLVMLREEDPDRVPARCRPLRCLVAGAGVGLLTGFLGVGGGFLLVPALVFFAGVDTRKAVGTSLSIIALNSAAGLMGQLRYAQLDWVLTGLFTVLALAGMRVGLSAAGRVSEVTLRKVFASLLLVVAVAVGGVNLR